MSVTRTIKRFGWKPDVPDHRDIPFSARRVVVPPRKDLAAQMPNPWDQSQLGSCTGHGWARVMDYMSTIDGVVLPERPSPLFIYYNERVLENTVDQDAGAEVRTGAKVVATIGACLESDCPYDITQFATRPSQQAYADAHKLEALQYQRIVVGRQPMIMRRALASGLPIVFGFSVPSSFQDGSWDPTTEPLRLPGPSDSIIGGHCVVVTGYDFSCTQWPMPVFQIDNSWGPDWGMGGRFLMTWDWFTPSLGLAQDLWIVQKVS